MPRQRVAVILNENARGVRPEVVERLGRIVPRAISIVSRDLDDSRADRPQRWSSAPTTAVLFGGGDGTFVQCLSRRAPPRRAAATQPLPAVGVLRLGTGNALADALGASRPTLDGLEYDLGRARRRRAGPSTCRCSKSTAS